MGQGAFRLGVIRLWETCAVTGESNERLLIASHIKPWSVCNNEERLDPANGLLLTPNLDKLFDAGFISFDSEGKGLISGRLTTESINHLLPDRYFTLRKMVPRAKQYLEFHRANVFRL